MRRVRLTMTVLAAMVGALAPSIARADEEIPPLPPPTTETTPSASATVDSVYLRNGGLYRGRVTEIVPGDHVTVLVDATGETKRIAWAEVDRVIVASTPIPPAPAGAATAPTESAPMVGPRARVHITSPRQVILYRRAAGTSRFVQACTSPCDLELPIGDTYRIAGNGLSQNKELRLDASPNGSVDIVVDPPSTGGMLVGGFVAGGGALAAYVGALLALVGAAESGRNCYTYPSSSASSSSFSSRSCAEKKSDAEDLRDAGLIALGIGVAAAGVGVLVFLTSAKTDVTQRSGAAPRNDAFVRTPSWRTASSSVEGATAPPAAAFPLLLTTSF